MVNILSFDIEDYFQVENFKKKIKFSDWDNYGLRVIGSTRRILNVLSQAQVRATFFVVGWIAERVPELIKEISSLGHEVASHGYAHELVYKQGEKGFRDDLRLARGILEKITGKPVKGYRAPCYSITNRSRWALDILAQEGYLYDSSIFPIRHDRGGLVGSQRFPHYIDTQYGRIKEFPISTVNLFGQNLPFSGGGYLRLLPYFILRNCARSINTQGQPINVYMHPWEFDIDQPRIKAGAFGAFRHYLNLETTEKKLKALITDFKFDSIENVIAAKQVSL